MINLFKCKTMLSYCLKRKKKKKKKKILRVLIQKTFKTSNGITMILTKCAICGSKKSKFIKKQEAKGLLSNLGISTFE